MNGETKFKIIGSSPIFVMDAMGNPVGGVRILFQFEPNHEGEIRISQREYDNGLATEKISNYIARIHELEGNSF